MTREDDLKHYRIMFVCHGNICRSPMAELIFRRMVEEAGLSASFTVASSATSTEEIFCGVGNPVYPPARDELAKHGISSDGKRAVQLTREDLLHYDLLSEWTAPTCAICIGFSVAEPREGSDA